MNRAVSQLTPTPKTFQLAYLQFANLDVVVQVVADRVECRADLAAEAGHGGNRAESDQTSNQGVFDKILAGLILHKGNKRLLDFHHHGSFSRGNSFKPRARERHLTLSACGLDSPIGVNEERMSLRRALRPLVTYDFCVSQQRQAQPSDGAATPGVVPLSDVDLVDADCS